MGNTASLIAEVVRPVRLRTGRFWSLFGVWHRHVRVYSRTLVANALPPVLEPLLLFGAIGIGLGGYVRGAALGGMGYREFVSSGLAVSSAMFTSVFETTFNTFVRLVYQKTYDAMLGTHLRVSEIFVGELLFCATKGAVFSGIVMGVTLLFGVRVSPWAVLVPLVGFVTAYLFGAVGLVVTSYVRMINNFAFFTTGVISPMFLFAGTFFPVRGYSAIIDALTLVIPLTHPIELARALYRGQFEAMTLVHLVLLLAWVVALHAVALRRMQRRVLG